MSATTSRMSASTFIRRLKLRALGVIVCVVLVVVTTLAMGFAWLPVMGVALAAVAMSVHKITHRLHEQAVCLGCGQSLSGQPEGVHGIVCPECGAIHSGSIRRLALLEEHPRGGGDDALVMGAESSESEDVADAADSRDAAGTQSAA